MTNFTTQPANSAKPSAERRIQQLHGLEQQPLVYLAGPYTNPDPVINTRRMIKVADALLRLHVAPIIPHLCLTWHLVRPRPYKFWLEYDLQLLARSDVVLRVPGSLAGADAEITHASQLRIPVLHPASGRLGDCVSAVRDWILGRNPSDQGGADGSGRD